MKILLILLSFNVLSLDFTSKGMKLSFKYLPIKESSSIWGLDFLDENKIIYTTKNGRLKIYNTKTKKTEIINHKLKNINSEGQGGLLDVIYYKGKVYLTYSLKKKNENLTALAMGTLNNIKKVYETKSLSTNVHHYGSRLVVSNNELYMTVGDRGERYKAQNKEFHNGKVLNFDLTGNFKSIHSLGHRNPQGLASSNNKLYEGEFGPQGGDEINLIKENQNYGWPLITFGEEYGGGKIGKEKGMTMPLTYWKPSISFSGINFYTGNKLSKWKNHLFLACLGSRHLRRVNVKNFNDQEELLKELNERIRMVRMSPDQKLYLSFDSGKIGIIDLK